MIKLKRMVLIAAALVALAMSVISLLASAELLLALRERPETGMNAMAFDGPTFSVFGLVTLASFFVVSTAAFVASILAHRSPTWCGRACVLLLILALPHAYWAAMEFIHVSPGSAVSSAVMAGTWTLLGAGCFWCARADPKEGT